MTYFVWNSSGVSVCTQRSYREHVRVGCTQRTRSYKFGHIGTRCMMRVHLVSICEHILDPPEACKGEVVSAWDCWGCKNRISETLFCRYILRTCFALWRTQLTTTNRRAPLHVRTGFGSQPDSKTIAFSGSQTFPHRGVAIAMSFCWVRTRPSSSNL